METEPGQDLVWGLPRDKQAQYSLYLGIASLCCSIFTAIPALILGWKVFQHPAASPQEKQQAKIGMGLGGAAMVLLVIVGLFSDRDTGGKPNARPTAAAGSVMAEVVSDPEYQEWVQIDRRTSPIRRDKAWLKETLLWLREPNKKWRFAEDEKITEDAGQLYGEFGVKKVQPDEDKVYRDAEHSIGLYREWASKKIVGTLILKRWPTIGIKLGQVTKWCEANGYPFHTHEDDIYCIYHEAHAYSERFKEVPNGKKVGQGRSVLATVTQDGQVLKLHVQLPSKMTVDVQDKSGRTRSQAEMSEDARAVLRDALRTPPTEFRSICELICGEAATENWLTQLKGVGEADDGEFPKYDNSGGMWQCKVEAEIGDVRVELSSGLLGLWLRVNTKKFKELWDAYRKECLDKK